MAQTLYQFLDALQDYKPLDKSGLRRLYLEIFPSLKNRSFFKKTLQTLLRDYPADPAYPGLLAALYRHHLVDMKRPETFPDSLQQGYERLLEWHRTQAEAPVVRALSLLVQPGFMLEAVQVESLLELDAGQIQAFEQLLDELPARPINGRMPGLAISRSLEPAVRALLPVSREDLLRLHESQVCLEEAGAGELFNRWILARLLDRQEEREEILDSQEALETMIECADDLELVLACPKMVPVLEEILQALEERESFNRYALEGYLTLACLEELVDRAGMSRLEFRFLEKARHYLARFAPVLELPQALLAGQDIEFYFLDLLERRKETRPVWELVSLLEASPQPSVQVLARFLKAFNQALENIVYGKEAAFVFDFDQVDFDLGLILPDLLSSLNVSFLARNPKKAGQIAGLIESILDHLDRDAFMHRQVWQARFVLHESLSRTEGMELEQARIHTYKAIEAAEAMIELLEKGSEPDPNILARYDQLMSETGPSTHVQDEDHPERKFFMALSQDFLHLTMNALREDDMEAAEKTYGKALEYSGRGELFEHEPELVFGLYRLYPTVREQADYFDLRDILFQEVRLARQLLDTSFEYIGWVLQLLVQASARPDLLPWQRQEILETALELVEQTRGQAERFREENLAEYLSYAQSSIDLLEKLDQPEKALEESEVLVGLARGLRDRESGLESRIILARIFSRHAMKLEKNQPRQACGFYQEALDVLDGISAVSGLSESSLDFLKYQAMVGILFTYIKANHITGHTTRLHSGMAQLEGMKKLARRALRLGKEFAGQSEQERQLYQGVQMIADLLGRIRGGSSARRKIRR